MSFLLLSIKFFVLFLTQFGYLFGILVSILLIVFLIIYTPVPGLVLFFMWLENGIVYWCRQCFGGLSSSALLLAYNYLNDFCIRIICCIIFRLLRSLYSRRVLVLHQVIGPLAVFLVVATCYLAFIDLSRFLLDELER